MHRKSARCDLNNNRESQQKLNSDGVPFSILFNSCVNPFFFVKIENSNTEKFCIGMHIQRSIMHADLDAPKLLFQRILNIFWWWWESICWAYCCTLFEKSNFCPKIQFSGVFHPNFFLAIFSWNQSCLKLKSPEPQQFHEFFTPQKNRHFFS